jgi:hypothetical protein
VLQAITLISALTSAGGMRGDLKVETKSRHPTYHTEVETRSKGPEAILL